MSEQANESQTPLALYTQRLDERQRQLNALERSGRRMGVGKLLLAAATLVLLLVFLSIRRADWLLALPVLLFVALAVLHERVLRAQRLLRMAVRFYEQGVARLEDRWAGSGQTGEEYLQSTHAYARDLDLFGRGSLFELLAGVRTRAGAETLAGWLSAPAAVDEIQARQQAVRELSSRVDFRERLATTSEQVEPGLHPEALLRWAEGGQRFGSRTKSLVAMLLALIWVASIAAGFALGFWTPALLVTLLNFALSLRWGKALDEAASQAEQAAADLGLLVRVLRILEDASFVCPRLQRLQADLRSVSLRPSQAFAQLERIVFHLEARRNPMLRVFDGLLFYSLQLTTLAEGWRLCHGASIARWIAAVGEMEALSALSSHAFEHPGDCFPEFVSSSTPLFEPIRSCPSRRRCATTSSLASRCG